MILRSQEETYHVVVGTKEYFFCLEMAVSPFEIKLVVLAAMLSCFWAYNLVSQQLELGGLEAGNKMLSVWDRAFQTVSIPSATTKTALS